MEQWRDCLSHYGVKGMKKGVRKTDYNDPSSAATASQYYGSKAKQSVDQVLSGGAKGYASREVEEEIKDKLEKTKKKKKKTQSLLEKHGGVKLRTLSAK